jgi:Holliday junction resolvasome RuvABC endonuclease subunit
VSRIFAIDPGSERSGWVILEGREVVQSGVDDNHDMLPWVKHGQRCDMLAIETMQANYAATVGASVIETLIWIGRFKQAWRAPEEVRLISRQSVKQFVCGNVKAKDSGVRQAMLDLLGPQGTKKAPGPTYGLKTHAWQALGVAVTAMSLQPMPVAERMAA